jgi:hypothetical protein
VEKVEQVSDSNPVKLSVRDGKLWYGDDEVKGINHYITRDSHIINADSLSNLTCHLIDFRKEINSHILIVNGKRIPVTVDMFEDEPTDKI